jgi:hypothetical protein
MVAQAALSYSFLISEWPAMSIGQHWHNQGPKK